MGLFLQWSILSVRSYWDDLSFCRFTHRLCVGWRCWRTTPRSTSGSEALAGTHPPSMRWRRLVPLTCGCSWGSPRLFNRPDQIAFLELNDALNILPEGRKKDTKVLMHRVKNHPQVFMFKTCHHARQKPPRVHWTGARWCQTCWRLSVDQRDAGLPAFFSVWVAPEA